MNSFLDSFFGMPGLRRVAETDQGPHRSATPESTHMLKIAESAMHGNASMRKDERISLFGTVNMTPKEWAKVIENPRQRDTEERASRAKHLKVFHPAHVKVNAAQTPDGRLFKLDGHTRSYLWEAGKAQAPAKLHVDIWNCADIEAVKELYGTFDSDSAVEQSRDKVHGALRELDLQFNSTVLRSKRFSGAARLAYAFMFGRAASSEMSIHDLVRYWSNELQLFDQCEPTPQFFHAGLIAAALLTFRRYGQSAFPFWQAFSCNAGTKAGGQMDAVQALHERSNRMRSEGRIGSRENQEAVIAWALSAFEAYRAGYVYSTASGIKALKQTSLTRWAVACKTARRGA